MSKRRDRRNRKDKSRKKSGLVLNIVLIIAICVFIFALVQLIRSFLPYFQGGAEYDDIKELAITTTADSEDTEETKAEGFSVDFEQLLSINPDTVAWVRFEEPSIISYPVVQGRDNAEYLTRTFQANDNKLGAIFMDYETAPDFSDRNTIIYGHNLNYGGEMFSRLVEYGDQSFYEQYPYFYIYTPDHKVRTYRIYAAGVVSEVGINYVHKFNSDQEFETYLNAVKESSAYNTGTEATKDSYMVTLSTCTNINETERFIVHGILQETGEVR